MPDASPENPEPSGASWLSQELQLRLMSGTVVAVIAFAVLYWGSGPFAILLGAIAAAMSWEWGRIVRDGDADIITGLHIATVIAAAGLSAFGMAGLAIAAVAIGAIAASALAVGQPHAGLTGAGVLYTGLPVVALEWLRSDDSFGLLAVLFVLIVVVVTDTAAYAAGRTLGGPKLWPAVSPNKTWAGLVGGVSAAAAAGAAFPYVTGSGAPAWLAALGLLLGLVAQAGDLAESALKRHFNRKDASDLIPGHGGFMDRMDGIVTASVGAALIALAVEAYQPARALLYGG